MKVTFVSPPANLGGGTRVIAIYAQQLREQGHEVTVVSPAHQEKRSLSTFFLRPRSDPQPPSHFDGTQITMRIVEGKMSVSDDDVPDADIVIATWWETAEWVNALSKRKGSKVYFVQHHEVFSYLPVERVRDTYRMPLHKIVIAKWLADVMRDDYGDNTADIVPNSVDLSQFYAPPREKRPRPTVGVLYGSSYWKRFPLAIEVLRRVHERLPELQVFCFGSESMPSLPSFASYTRSPPQDSLRDIYASCDVWLTTSSSEGFNLPAMEAMACRTPVVATRTGWPAEAVVDGVNGACVAVDDVDGLARETERLLCLTPAEWRCLSDGAFETVCESSWGRSAALFASVLSRVVDRQM